MGRQSKTLGTARRVLFAGTLVVASVVLIEALSMLVMKFGAVADVAPVGSSTVRYNPYLGWENAEEVVITATRCGGRYISAIHTDGFGRSITPYLDELRPDVSVVVLGGSTMFGVGSSRNETTVPSLLERELHEGTGVAVEVFNLGVNGYMSFQELMALHRFLQADRADVVVSISGKNDAEYATFEENSAFGMLPERGTAPTALIHSVERGELDALAVGLTLLTGRLARASHTVALLVKLTNRLSRSRSDLNGDVGGWRELTDADIEARARRSLANYCMMDALSKANGAQFVMFLQPTAFTKRSLTDEERTCISFLNERRLMHYRRVEREFYEDIRRSGHSFAFRDITACLDGMAGSAFVDESHYCDAGAETVARAVCDVIAPLVLAAKGHKRDL